MTSEVQICNMALVAIKSSATVTSIRPSDGSEEARYCALLFDDVRDEVLRAADWNFARRYRTLSLSTDDAQGLWDYQYVYPSDCLVIREITKDVTTADPIPYETALDAAGSSRVILTDREAAAIRYTAKVTDPELFDATFSRALAYRLAVDLTMPLTGDSSILSVVSDLFSQTINMAMTQNANEGHVDRSEKQAEWIEGRL